MQAIHGLDKSYMCTGCQGFFKTKIEHQVHIVSCVKSKAVDDFIGKKSDQDETTQSKKVHVVFV